jgi:uncharacterized protein (TIGR00369 family)
MQPLTDPAALRERMVSIFERMKFPGFEAQLMDLSAESGTVVLEFEVAEGWANPFGTLHGGVVPSLLDACLGMAGSVKSGGVLAMPLAEVKISFVRPVPTGKIIGKGETVRLGKGEVNMYFVKASATSQAEANGGGA